MGKAKKIAIGTIFAGVAGYIAGILTAPKSGKETRQDLKVKATNSKREIEQELKKLHKQLGEVLEDGKNAAKSVTGQAQKDLKKLQDVAESSRERVREILSSFHEGVVEDKEVQKVVKDATKAAEDLKEFGKKAAEKVRSK